MMKKQDAEVIHIENATENNLAHVSLDLPKYQFIVITGLSGSGKSTLAFDTLYMEARRRYLDTLSMYARQFVGQMKRPQVERVTGLTPTIAVVQGTLSNNTRSTVGTVTEIYDFIRLLWGRSGVQVCPKCRVEVAATPEYDIVEKLMRWPARTKAVIYAPLVVQRKGQHEDLLEKVRKHGFTRVRVDGKDCDLNQMKTLAKTTRHTIELVVDRVIIKPEAQKRIEEAVHTALQYGNGQCSVERFFEDMPAQTAIFSTRSTCPKCGMAFPELSPNMLAFNTPQGACEMCHGTGDRIVLQPKWLIGDASLPIMPKKNETSCAYLPLAQAEDDNIRKSLSNIVKTTLVNLGVSPSTPWRALSCEVQGAFLDQTGERIYAHLQNGEDDGNDELGNYMAQFCDRTPCPECHGCRLNVYAQNVYFNGESLADVQRMTVDDAAAFFEHVTTGDLPPVAARIVEDIMPTLLERLRFVARVGLGYLQLGRGAATLSGGEAQRIRLAGLLGNGLTAVTYILDEPSIGLHARDQARLIGVLQELRDKGNTVIAVEHDDATMRACDYLVDIGPKAGKYGGRVVFAGAIGQIAETRGSLTIDYLLGRQSVEIPAARRKPEHGWIRIFHARKNNLKNIDVGIPLGCIVCVTGVSGSGKSSLINEILLPAIHEHIAGRPLRRQFVDEIEGMASIARVLEVDQKPIGKTPRSNPATYTKAFDLIRMLFAAVPDAKMYGYSPSRFSFNVSADKGGGRCESCAGAGVRTIEMKFLSNTYVACETCRSKRFNDATLRVRYNGYSIADVLDMSFDEACELFEGQSKIEKIVRAVRDVGLGYIKLGQPSPTLSGGEAQRMKLAKEIARASKTPTLFVFDEPSTGLHADDVRQLIKVMNRLANMGHSVIIIEHNLDIIKTADYIIDIGPEPGNAGGNVVVSGTPEEVALCAASHTGRFLKPLLQI